MNILHSLNLIIFLSIQVDIMPINERARFFFIFLPHKGFSLVVVSLLGS